MCRRPADDDRRFEGSNDRVQVVGPSRVALAVGLGFPAEPAWHFEEHWHCRCRCVVGLLGRTRALARHGWRRLRKEEVRVDRYLDAVLAGQLCHRT